MGWDVKRLAVSLEIAGRETGFARKERSRIVRRAARSYRDRMRYLLGPSAAGSTWQSLESGRLGRLSPLTVPKAGRC
jgi:hypothetical protein